MLPYEELKQLILKTARECYRAGIHLAKTDCVLGRIPAQLGTKQDLMSLEDQQCVVVAWHDLFHEGYLVPGYTLDNPDEPFFHLGNPGRFIEEEKGST